MQMSNTYIRVIYLIMCEPEMRFNNQPSDDIMKIADSYSVVCEMYEHVNAIETSDFQLFVSRFLF